MKRELQAWPPISFLEWPGASDKRLPKTLSSSSSGNLNLAPISAVNPGEYLFTVARVQLLHC